MVINSLAWKVTSGIGIEQALSKHQMNTLSDILQRRCGGQINIRGIRYQILYALKRALELLNPSCPFAAIGLERFDDVDLYGDPKQPISLQPDGLSGGNSYFQAKTCDGRWVWSKLKEPIKNFLELLRADADGQFWLVLNFSLDGDLLELANFPTISSKRQRAIEKKFRQLCQHEDVGGTEAEADALLPRLHLIKIPEDDVVREIHAMLTAGFELHGAGVDRYLSIFFERFLFWSRERKVVRRDDLVRLREGIAQDFALETAFDAFGRGLLQRADWKADARPDDFYEGKETRTGHVASGLDVRRPIWHERIKVAFGASGTVIVRASSGQGKSTLALRYAHDEWPDEDTFILKTAQTHDEVEMVCSLLRHRVRTLGLPTYLLLDNAGRQTQLWPRVAQECLALGIPVLATLRQEDWYRFARTHRFSYEPVEPSLGPDEAKEIYEALHKNERIHASVESGEWAYEKIGEPHLLMEYVYLLTHGQMLQDRLRDQIADIETHDNSGKLEVLRRVAMADALSAPVLTDRLCEGVARQPGFVGDARQLIRSLEEEYLKRHGESLSGLHWVRSDHLVRLLHDDSTHLADTALSVLDAVAFENLSDAVSNALCRNDLEEKRFMQGIIERARLAATAGDLATLLALLNGVFEAGERRFLETNRPQFDEAHSSFGQAGPFLLKTECTPTLGRTFLASLREHSGTLGEGLDALIAISSRLNHDARGRDQAEYLLGAVGSALSLDALTVNIGNIGDLLAWHGWCGVPCPVYDASRQQLLERVSRLDFTIGDLQKFAEGLWLYDRAGYRLWLDAEPERLNGYLRWQLDCLSLERELVSGLVEQGEGAQGEISIEFFVTDADTAHSQTVDRIQTLYSIFPFYAHYSSRGIWPFAPGTALWHDPTIKNMTQEYQHLRFLVRRNQTWVSVVESHYTLDSFYTYQRHWNELRRACLDFVVLLSRRLRGILTQQVPDFTGAFLGGVLERTEHALTTAPNPPTQTSDELKNLLKSADGWAGHWNPFRWMFLKSAVHWNKHARLAVDNESGSDEERETARLQHLAWYNFRDVYKDLSAMQGAMRTMFETTADYFGATTLDVEEKRAYSEANELLDVWLKHPLPPGIVNIEAHVSARREAERRNLIGRLHQTLQPLEAEGMTFIYPQDTIEDFPLTMLPIGFSVDDPCLVESERDRLLESLSDFEDVITFFWLIPTHAGARFIEGGFRADARQPDEDDKDGWVLRKTTLNEQPVPETVWEVLPSLPMCPSRRLKLLATIHSLISQVSQFLRSREILGLLHLSGNFYDSKIYEKHKERLIKEQGNLGLDYNEMRTILEEEFGAQREEPGFICVETVLDLTQTLATAEAWEELAAPMDFDPENWRVAVNSLVFSNLSGI